MMKKYILATKNKPDRVLSVEGGLGKQFIVCYFEKNKSGGFRKKRFKSTSLPPTTNQKQCQENLDRYAKIYNLETYNESSNNQLQK